MREIWKSIKNYQNYMISNMGRVKRLKGYCCREERIIRNNVGSSGYYQVALSVEGGPQKFHRIHRLVLEAFVSPCPKGKECNHKDGNKLNNNLENLEWVTKSENSRHALKNGLTPTLGVSDVILLRALRKKYNYSYKQLGRLFSISKDHAYQIVTRKSWAHV
jgi:hypothetical protein